jgi:CBS domain-containing protein
MHDKVVANLMHDGVVSCPLHALVPDVARAMTKHDISAVVVVDEDECLAGIISRTDLATLFAFEELWPHLRAEQVMTTDVHTVHPDEPAVVAAQQIHQHRVSRLVVTERVEEKGKERPVGILSITDIVREMSLG